MVRLGSPLASGDFFACIVGHVSDEQPLGRLLFIKEILFPRPSTFSGMC